MKKAILIAAIGAVTLGVNAGDWGGKYTVPSKKVVEECLDRQGEVTVGYLTDYIFYGQRLARDTVYADVNYTFDNLVLPVNVGATYYNGVRGLAGGASNYEELALYTSAELGTYAGFDVSLGYTHYFFPNGANSYGEIGLDIKRSLGIVDLAWESNYALVGDGAWYHQLGVEKTFGLTENVDLVLGAGVGYSDNYFFGRGVNGSTWNHYYLQASLPIKLRNCAVLTPFIGFTGAGDGWVQEAQSDILHGGVSLTVSF